MAKKAKEAFVGKSIETLSPSNIKGIDGDIIEVEVLTSPRRTLTTSSLSDDKEIVVVPTMAKKVWSARKVWILAVVVFLLAFGITAGTLAAVNPTVVQQINEIGNPTGTIDLNKVFGIASVIGISVLVIYLLVILSKVPKPNSSLLSTEAIPELSEVPSSSVAVV
jgi:hypothetical protein